MLTSLAFAATTVTASHVIYADSTDSVVQEVAIVGSRVHFEVSLESDAARIDSVKIKSDNIIGETDSFGLSLTRSAQYTFSGNYYVTAGDVNAPSLGDIYQVFVYVDGAAVPLNTTNTYRLKIDNQIPFVTNSNSTWIESVPAGLTAFGIGDQMKFVFNRGWNTETEDVETLTLDLTSIGGPANYPTTLSGDVFTATYTLPEGGIAGGYTADVTIPMTMTDVNGNVSEVHTSNVISDDVNGVAYPAYTSGPSFAGISDLMPNGQFRFSPGTGMFGDWDTEPNTISGKIEIPDFGTVGHANKFVIRVENENTNLEEGFITFTAGDANVTTVGDMVTFVWDGRVDGSFLIDAVYGLTLVELSDVSGNAAQLTPLPPTLNPDITNGESELNVLDFVVDNIAPLYENLNGTASELRIFDSASDNERYTLNRHIDESANDAAEVGTWGNNDVLTSTDEVYFAFSVKRDFLNDTYEIRKEHVKYWIEVASDSDASFKKYFYPASSILGDANEVKTDIPFVETQAYAVVNSDGSFSWKPEDAIYAAGDYTVTAYIQDNAGNIRTSAKSVEIVNDFSGYVAPPIDPVATDSSAVNTAYNITSRHDGGTNELAEITGTVPNFYVDSYFPGGEMYYNTSGNEIVMEVQVTNVFNAQKVVFTRNNSALPAAFDTELSNFDNGKVTLTVPVSAFAEDATGTYTYGNSSSDISIKVVTRNIEDGPFDMDVWAIGDKSFNIIRPEQPEWPEIVNDIVNVVPHCISPGNPSWAYDAVTNPANEAGMSHNGTDKPFNEITFSIDNSTVDYVWSARVYDPDNEATKVKSFGGSVDANHGMINETLNFANLADNNSTIVDALASKLLNVELKVVPQGYSDSGYIAPTNAYSYATTRVDNENPYVVGTDADNYIANVGNTYYLANGVDSFNFDIETNEYLQVAGWTAEVYDEDTLQLVPGAVVNVTATPTNAADSYTCPNSGNVGYKNFNITAEIANFADGVLENVNYTLILRTPNDFGGNPGRYNNPPYPHDADAWHTDSSEAYVHFIVLKEAPEGLRAEFRYINSDDDSTLDVAGPSGYFEFRLVISGYPGYAPNQRGVNSYEYEVDFSNFTGVSIDAGFPTEQDLNNDTWGILYKGSYTGVATGINNGDVVSIPVSLELGFADGDNAVHSWNESYDLVIYDDALPTFTDNVLPTTVDENSTLTLSYEITDAIAGVQADQVTITCSDNNLIPDNTVATDMGAGIYEWQIAIPANYATNTLTFDFVAQDMVDNENTTSHVVDIISQPTVSNVTVLNNSPEHQNIIKNGDAVDVTFDLTDSERIDAVTVTLSDNQVFNITTYNDGTNTLTIDPFDASNFAQYEVVAANVEISHPYNGLDNTSSADSDPMLNTPFVDEDQVVISDLRFFEDGVESLNNEFTAETGRNFYVEATFLAYENHLDENNLLLNYTATATAGIPTLVNSAFESEEVSGFVKKTYTYRWIEADFDYNEFVDSVGPEYYGYVELDFNLEITDNYDFYTQYNEPAVAVAIQDLPTVSNVNIYNVEDPDQHADQGNHIDIVENHNKIKVTFDLTDAYRITKAVITLNNGKVETVTSGLVEGLNTVIIDDFGIGSPEYATLKVDDITITHPWEWQVTESSDASVNTLVPFIDNNQVVINDFRVYVNGVETTNYFSIDPNQNVRFEADVIAYENQLTTSNVTLTYKGIVAASAQYEGEVYESEDVTGFVKNLYTYSWDNSDLDFSNFANQAIGYEVVPFVIDAKSDFDFVATPYNQDVVALNTPEYLSFHGVTATRWNGSDPEGWFAPEHDLELTMTVNSPLANINPVAEFDNITNNFPDVNWINGDVVTTSTTPIPGLTIYSHNITWNQNPDVQACWNTYADGDNIQVEVRYDDFFSVNQISIMKDINIDLEIPTYDRYSMVQADAAINDFATANAIPGISNYANHVGNHSFDLTLNDPQDLNSYQFDGSLFVKRVIEDMNGVSVQEADVAMPTPPANWTVELMGSEALNAHELAVIWKFTPVDNTAVNNTDILTIQYNQVEDLVGHKNYAGTNYNSPSHRYLAVGPTSTIEFIASQADVDGITAFQYDGMDRMNAATSPYISNGNRIGLILEVEPNAADNASVATVEILADHYNSANQGWIALADAGNDTYYLNTDIIANTNLGWLPLEYRITYSTNEMSQNTVSNVYNLIDVTSTSLVDITVWSETLGQNGMYYVTPGDEATIRVVFNSDAPLAGTVMKPYITLSDFSNILDMTSPYVVSQNDISWDGTTWVAEVTGVPVKANHNTTSQVVSVFATNITGQMTASSTKIISYAGSGPIVPLIEHAELITGTATDFLAISDVQTIDPVVNVYINTQYQEYIDNVTIDPIAGLDFGAYTVAQTVEHNSKWMVTFPVTITDPSQFTEGQIVTLDITSYRDPFDNITTDVFEHEFSIDVEVDGNDFDVVLNNPGTQNPTMGSFDFTFDFSDFGETFTPAYVPALTDFVVSSPELVSDMNPTAINGNVASLTINATDFTAAAATMGNIDFTVTYTNIYGFDKSETINILLDATAPIVVADGITFESVAGMTSYSWGDVIVYDQDWTSLIVELEDPTMFGTAGVGNIVANVDVALGLVTPLTDALANLTAVFNGTEFVITFNGNYSGFDLAEGDYTLTIDATDGLGNNFVGTQNIRYAHAPAGVSATTDPAITLNSGNDIELEFLVNDPDGVVNTVEFQVYYDENNDGDYTDDLGNLVLQANDGVYPYGFTWDLSSPLYTSYQYSASYDMNSDMDNLDADENIRNYIVRVLTTSSQMRSVSDTQFTYSVADVTAPEVSDVLAAGFNSTQMTYDYITPANNNIDFTALVGTWTDVDYVELTVNGDVLVYDMVNPINWVYDATDIGQVVITAKAFDFVGNVSAEADFSTVLEIVNPSYDKFYNLTLVDYSNYDSDNVIANGTVYSPSNPLLQNNVRIYTTYPNGLTGISEIQFFVDRIETATGNVLATLPVNNDATVNPQYGNTNVVNPANCYDATAGVWNSWITVDPNLYTDNGNYDGTDYAYVFYASMIDQYTGIEVIQSGVANTVADFRVDYLKPELVINAASVTHTSYTYYDASTDRLVFDYVDYDGLNINDFVVDYNAFNVADNANITIDPLTNTVAIPWTGLDNIAGEGMITYNVTVTDMNGNVSEVTPIDVFVDNQAPQTTIANVAYLTDADNGGEAMNQIHAFDGNPIYVMAAGTENLSIEIDRAQILGLSSENTDTWANQTQPWYANTNDDIYPPVALYRNIDGAGWNRIAFDHEVNANNMYQFDTTINTGSLVEFAVIAEDTRGNLEGDVVPFDGMLDNAELNNAINLTVNVLYPTDITTTIVNHNVDDVISGLELLTAIVATPANVASVEFQYNDGMNWIALGTDDSMADVDYLFSIDNAAIPYAVIPGVHIELINSANVSTMVELDGANDNWSKTVTLARDTYTVNYYVDANNDGIIGPLEKTNYAITSEMINADGFAYQFDTTTIVDGSYLFRAVPFDNLVATDDQAAAVEMNLIIDNTAPAFDLTALNTVAIDNYNVLDENVEFTLAYANANDVYMVRAWLVDMTNPVNNYRIVFETYNAYDVRTTDFSLALTNVPDGNYYLKLAVNDFNSNINIQTPALGDNLYLDTNAPVITAVNNALNMSGIYTETHQFTVAYNDYLAQLLDINNEALGVKELEATFTHNAIVDVVNAKVSDDGAQLVFDWTPSPAMMNEVLVNGQDNILVNLDVNVTDLNDYVSADFNAGNFTLTSAEVGAKIMVVSDFRNNVETYHQTSVTNNNEITDVIGGNNLNMFAFLPEGNNVIVPNNVRFEYWDGTNWMMFAANAVWTPIANFAGTGTISGYAEFMSVNWNIANMDGDYTVRTVSEYNFGEIINETNLHIWNSTIVPEIVVSTTDGVVTTEVNRGTEYIVSLGNIVSTHPEFLNQVNYMYRFLDENDQVASPWNQLSGFTADNYNWTIGMDYLFAEKVQLAVQVENIFNNVANQVSFIANGGTPYVVDIVDSQAPMVTALAVTQAGNPVAADATVAIANALDIAVTVDNSVLDLSSVVIALDGTEVNAVAYDTNNQVDPTMVNYTLDISALTTGTYQITVTTEDFVGHNYTETFGFSVDTDAPTAALVLTENVNNTVTRGEYYTFNANAMDNVTLPENLVINYSWLSDAVNNVWTPIVLDANMQWMIPQTWVIGSSYEFKAVIADEYNNVGETVVAYQVFDNITPLVANSMNSLVDNSIFNMNDEFTLTFDVDASNIINGNIELQYADVLTGTWMSLGSTPAVINNGVTEVTFNGLGLLSGFYNFQAIVSDFAVPANQFNIDLASMVYFDASAPEVFFTNIDNDSEFVLGNLASITADVNYTDGTNNITPADVASVEFLINGVSHALVNAAPYTYVWNTALLANVGTYSIEAIVTDNDGFTNNVLQNVVVVTPDENDPYAVITGFEFNNEAISSDVMYATVNNWANNVTAVVAQYTTNNVDWVDFAINTNNNDPRYEFDFNAEAIQNAAAIKVLVKMNNGEETSLVYPINVTYNAGQFDLVAANGNIEIHENNNLVVVDTDSMPYVIRVDENGYAGYEAINANNEFNLVVNANNELPGYWLSGVANNAAWLKFVELDAMAASNGVTVNYDSPYWFVMLDNEMPLADNYAQITDQVLVQSNIAGNAVYTLPLTGTMAVEGDVVALAWNGNSFDEIDVVYNETDATMTFTAPVNTVVTVGQYVGFEMFVTEFAPVNDDVFMNAGTLWTLPNVTMDFTVYHEETEMGYQLPAGFGLANISITLNDGVNNVNNIALNNGLVSFDLINMNAGSNELMVNVEMNGFQANQTLTFNVDNTLPTIAIDQAVTLSAAERTLTATMEDAQTGLVDYSLVITNNAPTVTTVINVPMSELTVAGNEYSYELSVEELVTLVPQPMRATRNSREVASLNVVWTAVNNLNQMNVVNANITANVVVSRPQITIHNDGFENGWWLNPAMANNIRMTVVPADGRTIALEDINVTLLAITDLNPAGIVIQTSNPVPSANTNEYTFGFAQLQLENSLGLKVRVNAVDDIDVNNVAEQTFSLDYMDPVVTATAPVNPVVNYGNDVQLAFSFNDPQGHFVDANLVQHYSGASGIDVSTLVVTFDGTEISGNVNNGSFAYLATDLVPGAHTAVASVSDYVGNTASATLNFDVVGGPAPVVDFSPLANDTWWITTTQNYEFNLNVESGHSDTELQSVVANIIELPNNEVIQGPFSVTIENGTGTINFHGGVVTAGQNAIKVEVVAENDWAIQTTSSQTYPIDNSRPELTIVNPMADYNVMVGNSVNVNITAMDNMSGLLSSSIKVTSLNGDFEVEAMDDVTPESFNLVVTPDMAGTYVIEAQATDMAGNVMTATRNFAISAPAPIIVISDLNDSNGWVNTQNNNNITFTVDGNGYDLDSSTILASVVAVPSNESIYEPFAVNPVNGEYVVSVHGGVIPTDASAIKVVVMASNVAGGNAIANHSYPIDSYCPTIEFVSPIASAAYTQAEDMFVDVMMELSDMMPTVKAMASSGLDRLEMKVYDNANVAVLDTVKTNVANSYNCRVPVNAIGQYRIEATIYDRAGNSTNKMMNFTVEIDYSAINLEFTAKPYMYPSPLTRGNVGTFVIPTSKEAQVTIEIFDFAGKIVREMNYNSIGGNTNNMIQFDGRTNDGKRLPRGAYFARINVVDGAKELNKVVKIAIQ
jgi:hypothetical protein